MPFAMRARERAVVFGDHFIVACRKADCTNVRQRDSVQVLPHRVRGTPILERGMPSGVHFTGIQAAFFAAFFFGDAATFFFTVAFFGTFGVIVAFGTGKEFFDKLTGISV